MPEQWTVERVEELLTKITEPPWEVCAGEDYFVEAPNAIITPPEYVDANIGTRPAVCKTIVEVNNQTAECGGIDANFIAAAPEIIRWLLDEWKQTKFELDKQVEEFNLTWAKGKEADQRVTRARQEAFDDAIAIAKGELIEFSGDSEDSFFNCATQDVIGALEAARDKEKG